VTGVHVIMRTIVASGLGELAVREEDFVEAPRSYLEVVNEEARRQGVAHASFHLAADSVADGIIRAAAEQGCDLIFMASHGRRGITGLLLGSETSHVLTHCKIPVLVYR
jgi:nucleotide-binding universal stress UspA family protein